MKRLRNLSTQLFNQLLPTTCLLCGCTLRGELLCGGCELDLPHLTRAENVCRQCSLPLTAEADYCGQCLRQPPPFRCSVIPFTYEFPIDVLIHRFKYQRRSAYGRALADLLTACVHHHYRERELAQPDLIIPVPLHWVRRWHRGFNQTEVLAKTLSEALQIPLDTDLCRRRLRTPPQRGLSRRERQKNLQAAFAVSPRATALLAGKRIALVDDVLTTTATARAVSRLLLDRGAREVHLWALARTPDNSSTS